MTYAPPIWTRSYGGVSIEDVPLPGDESTVLMMKLRWALKRESLLTLEERDARSCTMVQLIYGTAGTCFTIGCSWCGCLTTYRVVDSLF